MNTILYEYKGIVAGEILKDIVTGNVGKILRFEKYPDGIMVIFQDDTGKTFGQYLDYTEFVS